MVRRHSSTALADLRLRPIVVLLVSQLGVGDGLDQCVGSLPSHAASSALTAFAVLTRSALAASASTTPRFFSTSCSRSGRLSQSALNSVMLSFTFAASVARFEALRSFGDGVAEDVGHPGHRLFPVLEVGEGLFLKLQFVGQVVKARRVVAAVPHERAVGLVGVDQDQQVLDLTGQALAPPAGPSTAAGPPPWDAAARTPPAAG